MNFEGKKALILGVANEKSLAWGIAKKLHEGKAQLAFGYGVPALEKRIKPLAQSVNAAFTTLCNVSEDQELDQLFSQVEKEWGSFDILIHSIAFANKEDLESRFVETSRKGFALALDISAYSLIACAKRAAKLMPNGGSIITLTYYGAQKVIPHYNVMGVAKAALEASVRYLAYDLGSQKIRVNAISAGPVRTLAAAGIKNLRSMIDTAAEKNPIPENIDSADVGNLAAFLASNFSERITGSTLFVDSGANIMGL
jgi:enoyl-[acyl-carrier protein] reductase I